MPLIDVVFLLLTFFIYAMVVMVELKTSGVALGSVQGGTDQVDSRSVLMEIGLDGRIYIAGQIVPDDELDAILSELAGQADPPPIILAMQEGEGQVDRGPISHRLLGRIKKAGMPVVQLPDYGDGGT